MFSLKTTSSDHRAGQRRKEILQNAKKRVRCREGRYYVLKPRESCAQRERISVPDQPTPFDPGPAEDVTTSGLHVSRVSPQTESLSSPNDLIGSGPIFHADIFQDEPLSGASEYENSNFGLPLDTPDSLSSLVDSACSDTSLGYLTEIVHGMGNEQAGLSSAPTSTSTTTWMQTSAPHQLKFPPCSRLGISEMSGNRDSPIEDSVNQGLEVLEDIPPAEQSSGMSSSFDINLLDTSVSSPPDLHMNYIQISSVSTVNAWLRNALSLGIKLADLVTPQYRSPFYRLTSPSDNPGALLAAAYIPSAPSHLQPTLPQILFPHHSYLDLIPIPVLRARTIALAAIFPQLFNPIDVKMDIIRGGLVCRHDRSKIELGNGNGQPWDMRSWEAAPWFVKKWKILIDGEEGETRKQSSWWKRVRERDALPAPSNYGSFACG